MYVPRSYMENRNFLTQTWSLWVYLDICESCIFYYRNYRLFDSGRSPWKSLGLVLRWWRHSVAKTIIFSKAGWRRQILKILFAEREIQRRSWAGCTGWHWWSAKKKRSTRRVFKNRLSWTSLQVSSLGTVLSKLRYQSTPLQGWAALGIFNTQL